VTVNGVDFTFKAAAATPYEVTIGANINACAANLAAVLAASTDPKVAIAQYSNTAATAVVNVKYGSDFVYGSAGKQGVEGNAFTLARTFTTPANCTLSGANLTGGVDPSSVSVSVSTGIGTDLLSVAKELRFHPQNKAAGDKTDDFVMPLAATPGALTFAYKLEDERVYNVEFSGYPDSNGKLFTVGV
jgi:hypothetical protein